MQTILITGGAGFCGSHLTDDLISNGYNVRILDNLTPQVHGNKREKPVYLNKKAEFILGDVRDTEIVKKSLEGVDGVFHFAASVGVGQSMYEIENFMSNNTCGTSTLCECLINRAPVKKFIVASSMSIYGEGMYLDSNGNIAADAKRSLDQLKKGNWEPMDSEGKELRPIPTPENKIADLSSIYALSKYNQEKMCLIVGQAYNIPTVALRFFNVFGTRQALSNPYTGVVAIFASRLLNGNKPLIFEDGNQKRDFVSVHDVARACRLALENPNAKNDVFNIGSGSFISIRDISKLLTSILNKNIEATIAGKYRTGDIRHCFADISHAKNVLGYHPKVKFEQAMMELTDWLKNQSAYDGVEEANEKLYQRGLTL